MKRELGYGLILLAGASSALAQNLDPASARTGAPLFMMSGPASSSHPAQGYLGVSVRDISPDEVAALKLKDTRGAEIILVDHDAPAGKAGLHEHDVVLMMNGQAIEGQDQLRRLLHESAPGKTIILVVSREGQVRTFTTQMALSQEEVERQASEQRLTVNEPQEPVADTASISAPAGPAPPIHGNSFLGSMLMNSSYTGAMLEQMSSQLGDFFGVPSGAGLLVRSVQDNSPAALAGMHAGDVVIRADAKPVATTSDWAKAIKNSHGHPIRVVVVRDKKEQTLTLTPNGKTRSYLQHPQEQDQPRDDAEPVAVAHLTLLPLS
jgi:S1-C subfamily serine protease